MEWAQFIPEPLRLLARQLLSFIPKVFGALLILVVGWVLAAVIRGGMIRLLQAVGLERLSEKAKLSEMLRRGAIRMTFVEFLGHLVYWLIVIATVFVALQFGGITAASEWLGQLGAFIPRILVSILILFFGMLLASFLGAMVRAASLNAGFPQGRLLGQVIYTVVVVLTVTAVLEHLHVVTRTIEITLYILLGTFGLGFALALGMGSQEFVKRFLGDILWDRWKSSKK